MFVPTLQALLCFDDYIFGVTWIGARSDFGLRENPRTKLDKTCTEIAFEKLYGVILVATRPEISLEGCSSLMPRCAPCQAYHFSVMYF